MTQNRFSSLELEDEYIRKNAYNILSNKQLLQDNLYKTSMCRHKNCTIQNCSFAHNLDELRVRNCIFGEECLFINSKNKPCMFKHPHESLSQYKDRIKLNNTIKQL